MSSDQVNTMNLSDNGDGMVPINNKPSVSFAPEKNVSEHKETTMDSTPINDIMMEQQPMMMADEQRMPAVQHQGMYPPPAPSPAPTPPPTGKKNPLNLTDEQLTALVVAACTAVAVSKPVQDRLASSIPKFLNEQGSRSVVGLAVTGVVAAVIFYIGKDYIVKA
jgi:hypothetical protein